MLGCQSSEGISNKEPEPIQSETVVKPAKTRACKALVTVGNSVCKAFFNAVSNSSRRCCHVEPPKTSSVAL